MYAAGGGTGAGSGDPLAARMPRAAGGGTGAGSGDPLAARTLRVAGGGVGAGRGEPLKVATNTELVRLQDKCLPEVLTGSTIKIAATSKPNRMNVFFVMDEPSWLNHEGQAAVQRVLI